MTYLQQQNEEAYTYTRVIKLAICASWHYQTSSEGLVFQVIPGRLFIHVCCEVHYTLPVLIGIIAQRGLTIYL